MSGGRTGRALPAQESALIGRARELKAVRAALLSDEVRLLTLCGPAGIGKTRLALATAASLVDAFEGVFFIDLAPISHPAMVAPTIGDVLGLASVGELAAVEQLRAHVDHTRLLLVLDNMEQVLAASADIGLLLSMCPRLKILATSREPLHLRWEHQYPVPPLDVPDLHRLSPPRALAQFPSVALFVARAKAINPEFALSSDNAAAVAELCVRLDGLPLAIELAAARAKVLPPEATLERLGQRLDLLTSNSRDQPPRHRTLRAALDWSYNLLGPAEQALFRSLGVCVGGCSLQAAETFGASSMFELLTSLVDKSLLWLEQPLAGEPRFRMLDTVRAYALDRLEASGQAPALRQQHAEYFIGLAEEAEPRLRGPDEVAWLERLEREHENFRTALGWCLESRATQQGLRLGASLWPFWYMRGHFAEGMEWLSRLVRQPEAASPSLARAKVLNGLGALAWNRSSYALAESCQRESLTICGALADPAGVAASLNDLGLVAWHRGDHAAAQRLLEQALAWSRCVGDSATLALHLNGLANVHHDQGDYEEARRLQEQSLAGFVEAGSEWGAAMARCDLARTLHAQGDMVRARVLCQQSLSVRARIGDRRGLVGARVALGHLACDQQEYADARSHFAHGLALAAEVGDRRGLARVLEGLAVVSVNEAQPETALRLASAAAALREAIGAPASQGRRAWLRPQLESAMRALGTEGAARVWAEGSGLSPEQVAAAGMACLVQSPATQAGAPGTGAPSAGLTSRERKTAALLARGLSNRQIAAELVVTEGTAKLHVKHILRKLGFTSRAQITAWSLQHGLLETAAAQQLLAS